MRWWPFGKGETPAAEPDNIRAFNAMTVHVLGKLYGSFPEPIDIEPLHETIQIVFDSLSQDPKPSEADKHAPSYLSDTIRWLEAERFIRIGNSNLSGRFNDVVLTERALLVMGRVPTSIKAKRHEKRPLGELMREAAVKEGIALNADLVKALLSGDLVSQLTHLLR